MRTLLLLTLVAVTACSARRDDDETRGLSVSDVVGDWSTNLTSRNNSGITGEANVASAIAGSAVRVTIAGAAANSHLPWHVHRGTCDEANAPIVGSADSYPPLHVAANGTANAAATIGVALHDEEKYHVNVHRSPTELNVIVACGNLKN